MAVKAGGPEFFQAKVRRTQMALPITFTRTSEKTLEDWPIPSQSLAPIASKSIAPYYTTSVASCGQVSHNTATPATFCVSETLPAQTLVNKSIPPIKKGRRYNSRQRVSSFSVNDDKTPTSFVIEQTIPGNQRVSRFTSRLLDGPYGSTL